MKVYSIRMGDELRFWFDRAKAEAAALMLGEDLEIQAFRVEDAPDTSWRMADAVKFMGRLTQWAYLAELYARANSFREATKIAGLSERHLRRVLADHGVSAWQFRDRRPVGLSGALTPAPDER